MEWVQEHFFHLLGVAAGLVVVSWLYHHSGKLFQKHGSKSSTKVFCNHCNWDGFVSRKRMRCKKCGSPDLNHVTH